MDIWCLLTSDSSWGLGLASWWSPPRRPRTWRGKPGLRIGPQDPALKSIRSSMFQPRSLRSEITEPTRSRSEINNMVSVTASGLKSLSPLDPVLKSIIWSVCPLRCLSSEITKATRFRSEGNAAPCFYFELQLGVLLYKHNTYYNHLIPISDW